MARSRAVLFLVAAIVAAVIAATPANSESKPTILTPIADTPLGSFEGADRPVTDDAIDDEDAALVGSPIGTTMTEPKPELTDAPPDATEGGNAAASGATTTSILAGAPVAAFFGAVFAAFTF